MSNPNHGAAGSPSPTDTASGNSKADRSRSSADPRIRTDGGAAVGTSSLGDLLDDHMGDPRYGRAPTECDYCSDTYIPADAPFDSEDRSDTFCSIDCFWRSEAHDMLLTLFFDHRFCANCYRQFREVEPPGPGPYATEWHWSRNGKPPENAIGNAYGTTESGYGYVVPITRDENAKDSDDGLPADLVRDPKRPARLGLQCKCGMSHHTMIWRNGRDNELQFDELKELAKRLSPALRTLYLEDEIEYPHSEDLLIRQACEYKTEPDEQFADNRILEYATADAIRAPSYTSRDGVEPDEAVETGLSIPADDENGNDETR